MWLELGYFFKVLPDPPDFVEGWTKFGTPNLLEAVELVGLANRILADLNGLIFQHQPTTIIHINHNIVEDHLKYVYNSNLYVETLRFSIKH